MLLLLQQLHPHLLHVFLLRLLRPPRLLCLPRLLLCLLCLLSLLRLLLLQLRVLRRCLGLRLIRRLLLRVVVLLLLLLLLRLLLLLLRLLQQRLLVTLLRLGRGGLRGGNADGSQPPRLKCTSGIPPGVL